MLNSIIALIKDNRWYFSAFLLFLIVGAIFLFQIEQGDSILYFSERRASLSDLFFLYFTKMGEEIIYLSLLISFLFVNYRVAIVIPLTGVLVTIVSLSTKAFFAHDRPAPFFKQLGNFDSIQLVEGAELLLGKTSFPSGHTMSAFAIYGLLAFLLPKKRFVALALFAAALLVGISRIYLVQHFLKDIYAGAILGTLLAMVIYLVQNRWRVPETAWYNRSLLKKRYVPASQQAEKIGIDE